MSLRRAGVFADYGIALEDAGGAERAREKALRGGLRWLARVGAADGAAAAPPLIARRPLADVIDDALAHRLWDAPALAASRGELDAAAAAPPRECVALVNAVLELANVSCFSSTIATTGLRVRQTRSLCQNGRWR